MAQSFTKIRGRAGGFTMIELLVVIAITAIILGLLFGPIIQGFSVVRRAQSITAAQDAARFGLERLRRELSEASFVYDNSDAPLVLPIGPKPNANLTFPVNPATGQPDDRPPFNFMKIDFVPARTLAPGANDVVDPTTGGKYGGAELRFPLAPGRRVRRYWIGLRNNLPDAQGNPARYHNVYEFRQDDASGVFNPFILWRADFDPSNPNLVRQDVPFDNTNPDGQTPGGFNDRNFFYNTNVAPNGNTFAENWRAIASPVISAQNLDLLAWNRDAQGDISATAPFRPTVGFRASAVVGDTATPGYLTDTGNESPAAVPSLYTTKYGQWVLPYTVTFYRGATQNSNGTPSSLTVRVTRNQATQQPRVELVGSGGNLATTQQNQDSAGFSYRFRRDGSLFVNTANLTFQLDPARGRVITGFPPLAGVNGIPLYDNNGDGQADSGISLFGEPIPVVFRSNTRHPQAGTPPYKTNHGIVEVELMAPKYFNPANATPAIGNLAVDATGFASPLMLFGPALIIPGSERVLAPDSDPARVPQSGNNVTIDDFLVPYFRIPTLATTTKQESFNPGNSATNTYQGNAIGPLNYKLDVDLNPLNPKIIFDDSIVTAGNTTPPQGLPAKAAGDPGPEREVQVTYLWQNNYNRNNNGEPIDARGRTLEENDGRTIQPEADVVKVDYSTRSLINIRLGVRVYDSSSGQPQLIEVTDNVRVNNVGR